MSLDPKFFVERTEHGRFGDPILEVEDLAAQTALTLEDTKDALFELSAFFKDTQMHVLVKSSLFTEFDKYWKPWDARSDALKLAADIMNDPDFPSDSKEVSERYGWEARRLNPAVNYLFERGLMVDYKVMGDVNFEQHRIVGKTDELRRFLKSSQY